MRTVAGKKASKLDDNTQSQVPTGEDLRALIGQRAFELYEQNGREDGHDVEHWLQAEKEIAAGQASRNGKLNKSESRN